MRKPLWFGPMRRKTLGSVASVIAVMLVTALNPSPAHAAESHGSGLVVLKLGAKGSWQRVQWNLNKQIVHLGVQTGSSMNRNSCQEASFDWRVRSGGGHYDQRTVRNCKPGSYVSTDPGGDATGTNRATGTGETSTKCSPPARW